MGRRRQSGLSLIEVMVSVVILTLGLLSMAALHVTAQRYTKSAEFRTTAIQLAEDLSDRMRANVLGVRNGDYVRTDAWSVNLAAGTIPPITCTSACDEATIAQQVAANDMAQWINTAVSSVKGAGLYAIQPGGANSSVMNIWVSWIEPGRRATGTDADAENAAQDLINDAYRCPTAMDSTNNPDLRCVAFTVAL